MAGNDHRIQSLVSEEVATRLSELAEDDNRTVSDYVRQVLTQHIRDTKK